MSLLRFRGLEAPAMLGYNKFIQYLLNVMNTAMRGHDLDDSTRSTASLRHVKAIKLSDRYVAAEILVVAVALS